MTQANDPPSFAKGLLEQQQESELNDEELAYLAGSMFGAGSDTVMGRFCPVYIFLSYSLQTASALSIMMMASALHPKAQARVQEELDRVVGRDRGSSLESHQCRV